MLHLDIHALAIPPASVALFVSGFPQTPVTNQQQALPRQMDCIENKIQLWKIQDTRSAAPKIDGLYGHVELFSPQSQFLCDGLN